jgi:acetyl-CoA carboxylase beta subunit
MLSARQGSVEMRKITFAVYSSPKEGLPYLAVMIAPNGDVAAAAAYKTAAEAETCSLKMAMETAKVLQ